MDGGLRERREALGLSLDEIARRTRIGREHLQAIEDGRLDDLPPGPYRQAWTRALHEVLGLEEPEPDALVESPPLIPLGVVRWVALGAAFGAIGLVAWLQFSPSLPRVDGPAVTHTPDLHVGVTARRTVRLTVDVDGERAWAGELAGGETRTFDAHQTIDLALPAVDAVRLSLNGATVVPQGRQDAPRTIRFVDDGT